jgi:hypothetical protein
VLETYDALVGSTFQEYSRCGVSQVVCVTTALLENVPCGPED